VDGFGWWSCFASLLYLLLKIQFEQALCDPRKQDVGLSETYLDLLLPPRCFCGIYFFTLGWVSLSWMSTEAIRKSPEPGRANPPRWMEASFSYGGCITPSQSLIPMNSFILHIPSLSLVSSTHWAFRLNHADNILLQGVSKFQSLPNPVDFPTGAKPALLSVIYQRDDILRFRDRCSYLRCHAAYPRETLAPVRPTDKSPI